MKSTKWNKKFKINLKTERIYIFFEKKKFEGKEKGISHQKMVMEKSKITPFYTRTLKWKGIIGRGKKSGEFI